MIGWQAELALCDWLVESRDPVEGTWVFSLPFPLCPLQLNPGVAGERDSLQSSRGGGGGL